MSTLSPTHGLQLDADTIVLYKSIAEIGADHIVSTTLLNHGYVDSGPNGYDLIVSGSFGPYPMSGPLEFAGTQLDTPQYACGRRYNLPNVGGRPNDATPQFAIDQAFNDAFRDVGGFVQQVMFNYDPQLSPSSIFIMGCATGSSTSTGADVFNLMYMNSSYQIIHRMERENADASFSAVSAVVTPGVWTVVTSVFIPDGGTGYDADVYLHELNAGVVTGGLKNSFSGGLQPVAASGLTIDYHYGSGQFFQQFEGRTAFGRIYKGQLDLANVTAQAEELLLTGALDTIPNTDDLIRHEFNDAPGWIDEGPFGMHAWGRTESADFLTTDDDNKRHIDVVGSGGRARQNCTDNQIHMPSTPIPIEALYPGYGNLLESFFNTDVLAVPEYTFQMVGVWGSATGDQTVLEWSSSGEPSYTNYLLRFILDLGAGTCAFFSESGGGVNVVISDLVNGGAIAKSLRTQTMLLTFRCGETAPASGIMRYRVSVNDQIDHFSGTLSTPPTDGEFGMGVNVRWPSVGYFQELKLSFGEITDQNIIDDFARIGDREGAVGAGVTYRMRATDTDLSEQVFWNATLLDDTGAQYSGNSGALIDIVVQMIIGE